MAKKRWQELSPLARITIVVGAAVDAALKSYALRDIWKRPAAQVKGPKPLWGVAVALSNSFGVVPLVYLLWGRRNHAKISS